MSIKQIIQESINKNPVGLKEALEEELRTRVALALEAKMNDEEDDMEDEEDEDEELAEATTVVYRNKETGEIWSKDFDDVIAAQRAYQMYKTRDYASNVKIGSPDRMKLVAKGLKNKS